MSDIANQQLLDLPPSAKLIFRALQEEEPLTQKQIAKETQLSPRTVRSSLGQLEEIEAVDERSYFMDNRQKVYKIV
jgi:transcriptional antiterminator